MIRRADARLKASIVISNSIRVLVNGRGGRLHDEDVIAPDALLDLNVYFTVGEALDGYAAQRNAEPLGYLLTQFRIARPCEKH